MPITVNIQPITSPNILWWKPRYRVKGTNTWLTNGITPAGNIPTNISTAEIVTPYSNTVYEIQIVSNCAGNENTSLVYTRINRDCPTLLSQSVITTDTSISLNFPINTPSPISAHINNIVVILKQGQVVLNTQILSVNSTNTVIFNNLTENTTYTIEYTINFTSEDNPPLLVYEEGVTSQTHKCSLSVTTEPKPECPDIIVTSITQS